MAKKKTKSVKTGMSPTKDLIGAARKAASAELPDALQGVSGIIHLGEHETVLPGAKPKLPNLGEPGQAHPVKGQIKALVMPVDVPTLCVDTEGSAHDVVCYLADLRASAVKTGGASAYGVGRLEELMRRLNRGVERLKIEIRKQHKITKE